jgi:hypothetical protein
VEYDGFVLPGGATSMFGGFPRLWSLVSALESLVSVAGCAVTAGSLHRIAHNTYSCD